LKLSIIRYLRTQISLFPGPVLHRLDRGFLSERLLMFSQKERKNQAKQINKFYKKQQLPKLLFYVNDDYESCLYFVINKDVYVLSKLDDYESWRITDWHKSALRNKKLYNFKFMGSL
jgi:hypothetical protein